jgi:uncharacterized HAD superfamily protein
MNLGIDIDGCLTELDRQIDMIYKSLHIEKVNNDPNRAIRFGISQELTNEIWKTYFNYFYKHVPMRENANEVINLLKEKGYTINIISARTPMDYPDHLEGNFLEVTKAWLKNNNIYYDKLNLNVSDKGKFCEENNIDLMIEDRPHHIESVRSVTPVLIMNCSYNFELNLSNTKHVNNWLEIKDILL